MHLCPSMSSFFSVACCYCCCCCININPLQPLIRILFAYDFEHIRTHTHTRMQNSFNTGSRSISSACLSLFPFARSFTHTLSLSRSLARALFLHFISFHLFHLCVSLLTSFAVHFITVFFFALRCRCRCLWLWLCSCLLLCVVASSPSYVCIAPSVTVTVAVLAATADVAAATAGVAVLYLDFGFNGE